MKIPGILLFAICIFAFNGCVNVGTWDLSNSPPFDAYAGREVVLNVPCVLYKSDDQIGYGLTREARWESIARDMNKESLISIHIPKGTTLYLENTTAYEEGHMARKFRYVMSVLRNNDKSGPIPFGGQVYYYNGDWDLSSEGYTFGINAAPWEPLGTPRVRTISIKKGNEIK